MQAAKRFLGTVDRNVDRGVEIVVALGDDDRIFSGDVDRKFDHDPFFAFVHGCDRIDADNIEMKFAERIDRMHQMIFDRITEFDVSSDERDIHGIHLVLG